MTDINLVLLKDYLKDFRAEFSETSEIFNTLSSGKYINKDSSSPSEQRYYKTLVSNNGVFKEYFLIIGFELVIEDGYCYFMEKINSLNEEKITSENQVQLNKTIEYIEIFILLKAVFNSIDLVDNYEFTISKLEEAINNNSEFRSKVPNINKSESNRKAVENLLLKFTSAGFIEEIDKKEGRYKTLSCLGFIKNIADILDLNEDS